MRSVSKRIGALFCSFGVILMFMAGLMLNASAIEATNGILTLTCAHDGYNIASMEWKIYQVGEKNNGDFVLTGDFADYPVDLSDISDIDRMTEIASTLNNFAVLDRIEPLQSGKTDESGVVQFSNLPNGLYLAIGTKIKIGEYTYFPSPLVFEVDGNKHSTLNSLPKFYVRRTMPGSSERFILRKVWANADGQDVPEVLRIGIYEDGELHEEIQLTGENGWTYSWDGSSSSEWRVKELSVPAGCYVMYRNNETQFIIMNAYDNMLLAQTTTTTTTTSTTTTTTTTSTTTTSTTSSTSKTSTTTTTQSVMPASSSTSSSRISNLFEGSTSRTTTTTTSVTTLTSSDTTDTTLTSSGTTNTTVPTETESTSGSTVTTNTNTGGTQISETSTLSDTSTTDSGSSTTTTSTTKINTTSTNRPVSNINTTTINKLPQTGQLWWPVPLMLLSGLVFVAVGLRLIMESRKED